MGIYDREYYREEEPGIFGRMGSRSVVVNLMLINAGVFVVQLFTRSPDPRELGWFTNALALHADVWRQPLTFFQFVTYSFLHDSRSLWHILFNMLGLWFFGRDVENKYGSKQFLSIYLTFIIVGGLAWVVAENLTNTIDSNSPPLLGASGGVVGVVILFAINFPKRTILLWFVIPLPAWVLGVFVVVMDLSHAIQDSPEDNVAYTCHLGGALMALLFYKTGWHLGRLLPSQASLSKLKRQPRLRVHDPEDQEREVSAQVDAILQKIQQHGQESLTRKERKILEDASRRYQQKHR